MTHKPFLIIGLPRSRTAWLANYFTVGSYICYHDRLYDFEMKHLFNSLDFKHGDSDSGLCLYPNEVLEMEQYGKVRILVVDRNLHDCQKSLDAAFKKEGIGMDAQYVISAAIHGFEVIKRFTKGMVVNFNDIDSRMMEIHKFLLPTVDYSIKRHKLLINLKITQEIKRRMNYAGLQITEQLHLQRSKYQDGE